MSSDWKTWEIGDSVIYTGRKGEPEYLYLTLFKSYPVVEGPDKYQNMLILDDDGDETTVIVCDFMLDEEARKFIEGEAQPLEEDYD